ncbi:MAG: kinase [Thiohalomonadales bacterium]
MIISKTPFRISFFGGGTDYPAWYKKHGGVVLSTTIDKYCYISCRHLPPFFNHKYRIVYSNIESVNDVSDIKHPSVKAVLGYMKCRVGLEIHHDGDLPARSGLGSSSSFTVGLLHTLSALKGKFISKDELSRQAIHIEQDIIGEHVGSQDQVSAAYGGLNKIQFFRDGNYSVEPVILPKKRKQELEEHCMLFFTGQQRNATDVAKSKIDNMKNRQQDFCNIQKMVFDALTILQDVDVGIEAFGELLGETWQIKRTLSDKVTNSTIDAIYAKAKKAGAIGGKLIGAGGGGFLMLFVNPKKQMAVRQELNNLIHVPIHFEDSGTKIVLYQPNGLD